LKYFLVISLKIVVQSRGMHALHALTKRI